MATTRGQMSKKTLSLKVSIEFPADVDLTGLPDKEYNILELSDFQDLHHEYAKVNQLGRYYGLKGTTFRWIFFSDIYESYSRKDRQDLILTDVFNEKWYRDKFMTVIFLDRDLRYGKYVIPATQLEYNEDKCIYDRLYSALKINHDYVGKYIKREK